MLNRSGLERVIRDAYGARVRGDLDGMMRHFGEGAHFSLVGTATASPVPVSATGAAAIREVLRRLTDGFEFLSTEIVDLVLDPETGRAAVYQRVRVRGRTTGQEAETEIVDLIAFDGDRISSFRQFADTALAARLLGT